MDGAEISVASEKAEPRCGLVGLALDGEAAGRAEAARTCQRLLLKGRWGGGPRKLRVQMGWDSRDQQTAPAAVPRFAALSLATL